jgi:D-arabinose 1-dehydrogenase-like Zn-dependent alcohol dehydrogenase
MKAIELSGLEGFKSLRLADVEKPKPEANQILIEVKGSRNNFAELELTWGKYPALKPLPYVLGFEAAGIITGIGSHVKNVKVGDKVTLIVSSGGYAEYATADAHLAIPIRSGISFAEASTIPVQGLSAYALLKFAAKHQAHETVLVQAAAGGVGLYLVAVSTQSCMLHQRRVPLLLVSWKCSRQLAHLRNPHRSAVVRRLTMLSRTGPSASSARRRSKRLVRSKPTGPNNLMYKGASQQQTSAGR